VRRAPAVLLPIAAALLWPAAAAAHGLLCRAFLPVPAWLFAWAAALVLVVSFVGLGALWRSPRLEAAPERKLAKIPAWLEPVCGALGVAFFALVVISGIFGTQTQSANLAPTAVYVLFWIAVPVLSVLAVLAVAYALAQLVGMAWFGVETWTARADGFAVAFNLFSRLSAIDLRDRAIWLRRPLSGTTALEPLPGTVALVCAMLGTTTFDGFLNGPVWRSLGPPLARDIARLGLGAPAPRSSSRRRSAWPP
jgi:hypothetical protein